MKTFLKIVGGLVLLLVVAVGGFLAFVANRSVPHFDTPKVEFTAESTPERIAKGRKWANLLCAECHLNLETGKLSGSDMRLDKMFGTIHSYNITQHPTKGIGQWTDGEIAYLLRTGIARDGRYTPPWMAKLPHMADEDLKSVIAFLRSDDPRVQPAEVDSIPAKPNFFSKFLMTVAFKPYPYPTQEIKAPPLSDTVAYGRYLVWNLDCYTCHSSDFAKINPLEPPKSAGYFGGGNSVPDFGGNPVLSANLTPDEETGIGKWSEVQFVRALRYGVRPDNSAIRYPMGAYTELTETEAGAIYAYLKTVPPIKNAVKRSAGATAPPTADLGHKLYFVYGCNSCHQENGVGICDATKNKSQYPTDEELITFIKNPAAKYPDTRMPSWEEAITPEDMKELVKHVRALDTSKGAAPAGGGR